MRAGRWSWLPNGTLYRGFQEERERRQLVFPKYNDALDVLSLSEAAKVEDPVDDDYLQSELTKLAYESNSKSALK
jgi:hypothetical protein